MACKRWIEAPVNGGRNYNGPKVREDAAYPRLDGKTP